MTPEYASPEQVRGQPVSTASDVYSLGVLLYELLAGRRPYELQADSLEAVVRTISETEPRPPSEAVVRTAGTATPAQALPTAAELRGDLDMIVLKALRKEPERRYRTVHELSEDLRRYGKGLPVTARADTIGYRTGKFVRRHRAAVAAAALVSASLVGGLVTTTHQARIAEANRRQAEQRFEEVRRLAHFAMFDMHDAISRLPGSTPARKQLVERALEYLDSLAGDATADPALLSEVAAGYHRLSELQGASGIANLGDRPGALASARKCLALRERVAASQPNDASALVSLALAHGLMAGLIEEQEAGGPIERMKAALGRVATASSGRRDVLAAWEVYWHLKALLDRSRGDFVEELRSRRRHVQIAEQLRAAEPSLRTERSVAVAYKYYSGALTRAGDRAVAVEFARKALALDLHIGEKDPVHPQRRLDLSFSHAQLASLLRDMGDLDGALAAYRLALELRRAVYLEDPANQQAFRSLVRGHESIADVLARRDDVTAAAAHLREALDLRARWERTHPSRRGPRAWQALFHESLADVRRTAAAAAEGRLRQREHWRRARQEYRRALDLWGEIAKDHAPEPDDDRSGERLRSSIADCDRALLRLGTEPLTARRN